MSKIEKKFDWIMVLTYIYLFTPIFLFCVFWLQPIYAVIMAVLILMGMFFGLRNEPFVWRPEKKDAYVILAIILALVVLWVVTSGVGASVQQYPDHLYRNAIYRILVDREWPVKIKINGRTKAMTYYIGFWLPAALVAKFTSYQMGFLFMQIWATIGLFLVVYFIFDKKKKVRFWYFLVFLFFGGADYLGYRLIGAYFDQIGNRMEWWAYIYNYPGVMTSTFWVYNQCIYAWLIFSVIMRQKNNKNILLIWSLSLLNCTFPAVGMMPFAVFKALENVEEAHNFFDRFWKALKGCFSWAALSGFMISLLTTTYIMSNFQILGNLGSVDTGGKMLSTFYEIESNAKVIKFASYPWTTILYIYLWFVLLEFGLYMITIYKSEGHKPIYWLTAIVLLATPLIKVGGWIDFCLRASIPALFILYHLVINAFETYYEQGKKYMVAILIAFSVLSSITCYDTLLGVMQPMANNFYNSKRYVEADAFSEDYVWNADNFFGRTDRFFYQYLAKKQ